MSKEKIEMTEKQFEELCKAVYPHLKAIQIGSFQSSKIHRQR